MSGWPLEVLTGERSSGSGITKDNKTMKLLLKPESASTQSIVGAVVNRLSELRDSFVHELGAVLLGYGDLKITEVINMTGEEVEGETEGPREVRVEGEFFLFKTPEVGQELICQLEEISLKLKKLTFAVRRNIKLEVYRDPASWADLYPGQRIVCQVDHASFPEPGQMRLVGRLVKPLSSVTLSIPGREEPRQAQKRRRPGADMRGEYFEEDDEDAGNQGFKKKIKEETGEQSNNITTTTNISQAGGENNIPNNTINNNKNQDPDTDIEEVGVSQGAEKRKYETGANETNNIIAQAGDGNIVTGNSSNTNNDTAQQSSEQIDSQEGEVISKGSSSIVLLASDGITAELHGSKLGQYSVAGEYCGSPYYLQDSTLTDSSPLYLYRSDENNWNVSNVLGKRGGWLKNPSGSFTVPETGWKVAADLGPWRDDPQLRVRCGPLSECGDITVSSSGPAGARWSECLGVFKRTDIISRGRPVFKHQDREKYLSIAGMTTWLIGDKPGANTGGIMSGAGANCPASARNTYSQRFNQKSWSYADNGWHDDPTFTVTCSNHSGLAN